MAVKKLSNNVQALFSSINIFSYKRAVEEFVYNALDAASTSIAIRVNIEENKIQVVDNGNGIVKEDFKLLGQRYATSKFVDMSHFKSAPNSYGFRGQALASIAEVSKYVKITSRSCNTEETWTKTFYKGKQKEYSVTTVRPSKGTTIEVNGFLYNMAIQSKSIDQVNELNYIKVMIEQLSLVHNNVSFSLRDDAKNEIILQVHKSRDVYQTLKSLFNIGKADFQELHVEKGEYKAKAFIAKSYDHIDRHHLIFLNKKVVSNKNLHKMIQDRLKKSNRDAKSKKFKSKNTDQDNELIVPKNVIPFYFIFITCPYYEYEISTPRQSTLEFKNWNQINTLIDKVIKFYLGDLKVKEITRYPENIKEINQTRDKVREIIKKYLGDNSKKPGPSQMQKGIKGKIIKRKRHKKKEVLLSKIIPPKYNQNDRSKLSSNIDKKVIDELPLPKQQSEPKFKQTKPNSSYERRKVLKNKLKINTSKHNGTLKSKFQKEPKHTTRNPIKRKKKHKVDAFIEAFQNPSDTLIRRCDMLDEEVENLVLFKNNTKKQKVFVNETVNYSSIVKNNKKYNLRNRVQETIIHNYIPSTYNDCYYKTQNDFKTNIKTSHDLLKTVLGFSNIGSNNETFEECKIAPNNENFPQLTFQSHHFVSNVNDQLEYYADNKKQDIFTSIASLKEKITQTQVNPRHAIANKNMNQNHNHFHDIGYKSKGKNNVFQKATFNFSSNVTSYTIDFSDIRIIDNDMTGKDNCSAKNETFDRMAINECKLTNAVTRNFGLTYTFKDSNLITENINVQANCTYTVHATENSAGRNGDQIDKNKIVDLTEHEQQDPLNIIFVSNSEDNLDKKQTEDPIQPLNMCEVIMENSIREEIIYTNTNYNRVNDSLLNFTASDYFCTKNCDEIENLVQLMKTTEIKSPSTHITEKETNNIRDQEMIANIPELCNNTDIDHFDVNTKIAEEQSIINTVVTNNFFFKNRPRFLPKGMSQIIKNCNNKNANSLITNIEYYEYEIYKRFMDDVQMQTEIYEPQIENQNEITTKAIDKINNKLNKETSSLTFSAQSLKGAKVLGQVDRKFIATIMKGKPDTSDYLVLFDQHAVHERIRLEENLADYYDGKTWKSVKLDDVTLKLSKEEILFLHNYKDKFNQFGLLWTVLNNQEFTLHAIPEAILGKNPRQVEKVINAVKNLISEEVDIIKAQKGCAYQYPKSIMDLVNSEACRYAIMFGDYLSKKDCSELIRTISSCKTPFQCAHGRPVMAVLMEIKYDIRNYKINMDEVRNFRAKFNARTK